MLNKEFIIKRMKPYLNSKRQLSEYEFIKLFSNLTNKEQYEVIRIMIENDIEYVDEKEEETTLLNNFIKPQKAEHEQIGDYKNLLNLTNEQLCLMAKQGNDLAKSAIIKKNERFIYQTVLRTLRQYSQEQLTVEDLFQEGSIAMLEAVNGFDISLDFKFTTYCWHKLRQRLNRAIMDEGYIIRLPVHIFEKIKRVNMYRSKNSEASRTDLIDIIIEEERMANRVITKDEINYCIKLSELYLNTRSLNNLIGEGEDTELMEILPDRDAVPVEEIAEYSDLREKIYQVLETLTQREKKVLALRYGLEGDRPLTLEEVGREFNVTRERIRQISEKALRKLRHPSRSKKLKAFYQED